MKLRTFRIRAVPSANKKRQNLKDDDRAIGVETSFSLSVSAGSYLAIESKVHNWQHNLNCFCYLELNRMRRRGGWNQIIKAPPPSTQKHKRQQGSTERSARPRPFCCSSSCALVGRGTHASTAKNSVTDWRAA